MSWMAIGGLVCLGGFLLLVLLVVAFLVWASLDEKATNKRIRAEGTPVLSILVMANAKFLNDHSISSAPALGMFTFEPPSPELAQDMREVADALFKLYTAADADIARMPEPQQEMAARLKDDGYRADRRSRVAREMSLGHTLYLADLFIDRDHIPDHVARTRAVVCMVTGKDKGEIMVLPHEEEPAQRIYRAIGAV